MSSAHSAPFHDVVIVGASVAGISAADTLRAEGFEGSILLVGDEPEAAYARPALSKSVLSGTQQPADVALPPLDDDIELWTDTRALALDPSASTVDLSRSGQRETIRFGAAVLATGCRPRTLGTPGQRGERVLRSMQDTMTLAQALAVPGITVAILGGGFLGMEIASTARGLGAEVTVVDVAPHLLRQLGPELAGMVTAAAQDHGVQLELSPTGAQLAGTTEVTGLLLAGGRVLDADLVITAVGDLPNVEWLAGSGLPSTAALEVGPGGFVVPGVVAAGDMTARRDQTGELLRTPHWHSAISQGRAAARTLLNGPPDRDPPSTPYFWTEGFGLETKITGTIPPGVRPIVIDGALAELSAVLQWRVDGQPVAAASVNRAMPLPKLKRLATPSEPAAMNGAS